MFAPGLQTSCLRRAPEWRRAIAAQTRRNLRQAGVSSCCAAEARRPAGRLTRPRAVAAENARLAQKAPPPQWRRRPRVSPDAVAAERLGDLLVRGLPRTRR